MCTQLIRGRQFQIGARRNIKCSCASVCLSFKTILKSITQSVSIVSIVSQSGLNLDAGASSAPYGKSGRQNELYATVQYVNILTAMVRARPVNHFQFVKNTSE
jgi:hypothetical protein